MHFFIKRIMKKIINAAIIFSLVYINNCSSIVEENDKPITQPVDIVWSKTGLDSCWVYSMVFMDNGDLFAGTSCGLLFSADSGASWSVANQVSFGTATCFYKQYTGRVFAGTSGQGLFTSSDNGISWNDLGLHNYNLTSIAVSSSGKVFVGTRGNGIFVADSLNQEWEQADINFQLQTFQSLLITDSNIIYAGGSGVYRSIDDGKNWSLKNQGLGNWPASAH